MTELIEFEETEYDEVHDMPSRNHSFVQTRIASLLFNDDRFTPFVELSLDASQIDLSQFGLKTKDELELIPDVCVYPSNVGFNDDDDELKMQKMPLLAIEIISPKQGISDILAKFKAYFALNIKSCWLITPAIKAVTIYSQPSRFKTFSIDTAEVDTEVNLDLIDKTMDIHLPLQKIFKR